MTTRKSYPEMLIGYATAEMASELRVFAATHRLSMAEAIRRSVERYLAIGKP